MQLITFIATLSLPFVWGAPVSNDSCINEYDFTVGQTVQTSSGPVTGHASSKFPEVSEYLGIPFGQAPVGDLRFAAPVKFIGTSPINGSTFGNTCPQLPGANGPPPPPEAIAFSNVTAVGLELFGTIGGGRPTSEDCLSLNIWTKPQFGEEKKAVMIYIYGGGFSSGSSATPVYEGSTLAEQKDVVIVTFNYRTSILGFPGNPKGQNNLAFLDQRLAIEWVRDNIANFGGDPARITLFGQSAGGASTDYLTYAYPSDPIVTGIIAQSGSVFAFGLPYTAETIASNWYTVTQTVGCGNASTDATELLNCMRTADINSIMAAVPTTGSYALLSPFGPSVDDTIVFANYTNETPASIPIVVGSNDYEPGMFRTQLALGGITFADSDWDEMALSSFNCPIGQRANASILANNPTWRYRFHAIFPNINISSEGGAYHGAELTLLFGTESQLEQSTPEEDAFTEYLKGAWVAFAKDPVAGLSTYEGGWPMYNPAGETLVRLGFENQVGTNLAFPELYDAGCADASLTALICRIFGEMC
ncbi:Alpha/Beta hydrolase protein [Rhexocercosporidium sp. MPI-PUGE-AT-0058]|nr:Alpha/Beta hydrolase protein [Rhexocercosporidium sp. MPI-PUGE-AT-0058]